MKEDTYDVVLAIGQAGGRFEITPERVGLNIDDARIPDNKGNQPIDKVIKKTARRLISQLYLLKMVEAIKEQEYLPDYQILREHLYVIIYYIN